ncbi:CU044_2847 family protein [Streptomyces sp. NPDC058284]|uniref:CU044_2847 family protein n=1 Tax=unclassified Streptomyces TaxID=2593676 RepID=UPI00365CB0A1
MDGLVEFTTEDGARVVVADVDDGSGSRLVSRGDEPALAARTFEASLDGARAAAASALRVFRDGSLRPDSVEIEFGVRMSAEAGAVIVKGQAEGHLVVRLTWTPDAPPRAEEWATAGTAAGTAASAGQAGPSGQSAQTGQSRGTGQSPEPTGAP